MTNENVRADWAALRARLDAEAQAMKFSQAAVIELSRRFGLLDSAERGAVEDVLRDWIRSEDPSLRFDALAIVSDYALTSALPALHDLARRLAGSHAPAAPYEGAKVRRLIERLQRPVS
jgi:hypothetical protein